MNLPNTGDGEHGPIYLATERALWALGPALLLLIALGYPSQQAARQQAAVDQPIEIAAENAEYCGEMGHAGGERRARELPAGFDRHSGADGTAGARRSGG